MEGLTTIIEQVNTFNILVLNNIETGYETTPHFSSNNLGVCCIITTHSGSPKSIFLIPSYPQYSNGTSNNVFEQGISRFGPALVRPTMLLDKHI